MTNPKNLKAELRQAKKEMELARKDAVAATEQLGGVRKQRPEFSSLDAFFQAEKTAKSHLTEIMEDFNGKRAKYDAVKREAEGLAVTSPSKEATSASADGRATATAASPQGFFGQKFAHKKQGDTTTAEKPAHSVSSAQVSGEEKTETVAPVAMG